MLDATRVETIEPAIQRGGPDLPQVAPGGPRPAPVHRRPVAKRAPERQLLAADDRVALDFAPPPARPAQLPTGVSWTPEEGFVGDGEPTPPTPARFVPSTTPRHERAPRATAVLVQDLTGVDVADTIIDRSPSTSERAAELGAVAFTEAGVVHLPAELGDLDEPSTRSVLAHELTHVAQQRRSRTIPPDEASDDGQVLEDEARAVQHAARRGVRPHVLRRRGHVPSRAGAPGVQRLADDARYAWQERDEEVSPRETREMTGLFGGYSVRSDSAWGRRIARDEQDWTDGFEARHARRLVAQRNERYAELLEQHLAERRAAAADPESVSLGRREVIAVRTRLDEEMPFEHGVPEGYEAFPDELPEPSPDEPEPDAAESDAGEPPSGAPTERPSALRTARTVPSASTTASASSPSARGAAARPGPPGSRRSASAGATGAAPTSPPGSSDGAGFDWQHREPTDTQAVAALFGGGLFGDLLGRAVGPDTDEDRARAERERLPDLLEQRQRRERELRHRRLQDHLRERSTVEAREEVPEADRDRSPIRLAPDEITHIREQIDRELPLEFAVPEYLPLGEDAEIARNGTISAVDATSPSPTAAPEPEAAPTPGTAPDAVQGATLDPGTRDSQRTDAATSDGASTVDRGGPGATDRGGATLGAVAAVGPALDALRGGREGTAQDAAADTPEHDREEAAASTLLSAASEQDIDALSRRVWSRIRREMRTELLVDRERAGVLADLC